MKLKNQTLHRVESGDFGALGPKCDAFIMAQGTTQRRRRTCESQRWWVLSREQYLRDTTGLVHIWTTETVAACVEPAQLQARWGSSTWRRSGHRSLL